MNVPSTALPGATAAGFRVGSNQAIPPGQYTRVIYSLVQAGEYQEVIRLLAAELQNFPDSRAALSLTAYCHVSMEAYELASAFYERLVRLHSEVEEYKLAHAQCLYKTGRFEEAQRVLLAVEDKAYAGEVLKLQACIKYDEDDVASTRAVIEQCPQDDVETLINRGCLDYKEGKFSEALAKFSDALDRGGFSGVVAYSVALCYFRLQQHDSALEWLTKIVDRAVVDHPEFPIAAIEQGLDVRVVPNSRTLHETALVQAFNLRAAILFVKGDKSSASEALRCMPPRREEDLDPVTLHNSALFNMDHDPQAGFEKFRFLLLSNPCPPETFANLLLLYCKLAFYDMAADIMTEYADMTAKCLTPELFEYIDATIIQQTAPEEAYRKFDALATSHVANLRLLIKKLQQAVNLDNFALSEALAEYDAALKAYIPVLMAQAKIYWDRENFSKVESILFQSVEFFYLDVEEDPRVKELMRRMGETALDSEPGKHVDALKYYEPIVRKHADALIDNVPAIVLANLCVSYVLDSKNQVAQEVIRRVEREEEDALKIDPSRPLYHSCVMHLVVGTLYVARSHYTFGISRIIQSFDPIERKLNADTWFYAKRCFLAAIRVLASHGALFQDETLASMLDFLEAAERVGSSIQTVISYLPEHPVDATSNVAHEARELKHILLRLANY
ncbi:flagellar associated protein [Thecamonas trahens ATCC 50062]|uniref:Flagellar associated protein n=1 Tax=Thecamonas trahens ATCC 50062 TaxID=461836 RepID=A0A0L0D4T3_THETB|nr:flagellar associated protein [Thecamonas trahens ATCC 50062]KNC47071.1 flagellar associated protein [Thecamonas trahens ATCC 50062]|eukprot:XP_013759851.1 flagellar associated protein [Thecamonas trahens ATCC 50062]